MNEEIISELIQQGVSENVARTHANFIIIRMRHIQAFTLIYSFAMGSVGED